VTTSVPLVEVVRNGFVEGRHHGSLVVLGADGEVVRSVGVPEAPMLPRSCAKPLQATAMVRAGLPLSGELLALACASHSGEPFHLDGVRRILAGAGLGEAALQTPPDLPLDDVERADALRRGEAPTPLAMNCSGKHAAMLATCVVNGWPTDSYRSPDHPLQLAIRATFEDLTGHRVETVAVDGCGAPLLSTTLVGLARAFRRLAVATEGPEALVAQAIRDFPAWVSGTRRDEAALLRAVPGAIAKAGAEACYAVALADGRAVALKVDDGSPRARPVVMAAALDALGVPREGGVDGAAVAATGVVTLYGGGRPVGFLRAVPG
jgi:L-asparaginase II